MATYRKLGDKTNTVYMDGKSLDELIFGKENDMSNYYFNNSPVVGE